MYLNLILNSGMLCVSFYVDFFLQIYLTNAV